MSELDSSRSSILADTDYSEVIAARSICAGLCSKASTELAGRPKYLPVFVMIGATSSIGDAIGPFVGWFLQKRNFEGHYLGDLNEEVHAHNLKTSVNRAWETAMSAQKYPYIVAVGSAVGRPGRITVNCGPFRAGAGVGKDLPPVGSLHVMGGTAHSAAMLHFTSLDLVVAMADVISQGLLNFYSEWKSGRLESEWTC